MVSDVAEPGGPQVPGINKAGAGNYISGPVLIPGPAGVLEGVVQYPGSYINGGPVAVVCHPHPLHGGTLHNKVVHTLARAFITMGVPTLRFNFRGVGQSSGRFDHGVGECDDLQAAAQWLQVRHHDSSLWLAGFSFGAFVALQSFDRVHAQRLLLVAPPVAKYGISQEIEIAIPWLVVQGGKDEVVDPQVVTSWAEGQPSPPEYRWLADAGHFFHGHLNQLRDTVRHAWINLGVDG